MSLKSASEQLMASIPSREKTPAFAREIEKREETIQGELRKMRNGILNQLYQALHRYHPLLKRSGSKDICEWSQEFVDRTKRALSISHRTIGLQRDFMEIGWAEAYQEAEQRTCREVQIDGVEQQIRLVIGSTCGDKVLLDNFFKNGMYQARRKEGDHREPEVLGSNRKRLIKKHMPETLLVLRRPTNGGKNFNYVTMSEALDSWFLAMEDEWYQKNKQPKDRRLFTFQDPRYWIDR